MSGWPAGRSTAGQAGGMYQSARAVHVIDDVISHDDDDVINYVRPADTGKSIVTTDIRRAGWVSWPSPVPVPVIEVLLPRPSWSFQRSTHRSKSRRELARQVDVVT